MSNSGTYITDSREIIVLTDVEKSLLVKSHLHLEIPISESQHFMMIYRHSDIPPAPGTDDFKSDRTISQSRGPRN